MAIRTYTLEEKTNSAIQVAREYKTERNTYLIVACISLAFFVGGVIYFLINDKLRFETFIGLFAPTGVITLTANRILHIFIHTLDFIKQELK